MTMPRAVRIASLWGPPLVLMALIFALSAMPTDDVDRGWLVVALRKLAHFTEYALLLLLWWRALRSRLASRTALGLALVITIAYSATDELHQTQVDGRFGTPRDVAIDTAGALLAAGLVLWREDRTASRRAAA